MEFLEHWRLRERPFELTWATRFYFQSGDRGAATVRISREGNRVAKLALEFAGGHGYPEVTRPAVDAAVRDMKCHETLTLA